MKRQGIAGRLAEVMEQYPTLSYFGMGIFEPRSKSKEEREEELAAKRQELRDRLPEVAWLVGFLEEHMRGVSAPTGGSYGLKHELEALSPTGYIGNGALIAAALIGGYSVTFRPDSPNAEIGFSKRDRKRLREAKERIVRLIGRGGGRDHASAIETVRGEISSVEALKETARSNSERMVLDKRLDSLALDLRLLEGIREGLPAVEGADAVGS